LEKSAGLSAKHLSYQLPCRSSRVSSLAGVPRRLQRALEPSRETWAKPGKPARYDSRDGRLLAQLRTADLPPCKAPWLHRIGWRNHLPITARFDPKRTVSDRPESGIQKG